MRGRLLVVAGVLAVTGPLTHVGAAGGPYRFLHDIHVGGEGGWDYLSVDSVAKRLYVSHGTKVVVIDTGRDAIVGEVSDTPGVHGMIAVRDLGRGFSSNGRENKAGVIDLKTLRIVSKVDTGRNPDFILFEPRRRHVYTFNGQSADATVIQADSGKVLATIPLGGKPEAGVSDAEASRVYVNVEDKNEIAVIDADRYVVAARWPIAPAADASGLAIDLGNHRLFVGARNGLMLMMDSSNGTVLARVPIGTGVDATWFDPGTGYVFSSCSDGTTTVAHEDSPEKLTVVQTLQTERGARTMALDPATHRIYLAAVRFAPPHPGAPPNTRPTALPDSMRILVYELVR
jgi:DNA-binding beta-propeller fold protein YncE